MLSRILNSRAAALRHAEKSKTVQTGGINNRFDIAQKRIEREILHFPVRQSAAPRIIAI